VAVSVSSKCAPTKLINPLCGHDRSTRVSLFGADDVIKSRLLDALMAYTALCVVMDVGVSADSVMAARCQ
jgi:hypothetical protein